MTVPEEEEGSTLSGSARRRGRQVALQVLYAMDLGRGKNRPEVDGDPALGAPRDVFNRVAFHFEIPNATRAFALTLVEGVRERLAEIDERVQSHSRNWRMDRMAVVDRNILRLATWELMCADTPVPVVLDEAIDLARRFADETSTGFVNGILDAVARQIRAPA
ncbi:MAG: transcription antitermination factor NusB [Myxococcota bacterium]|nr:transcription antitermination factor NusB [Myxococcota bacterium]